MNPVSEDIKDMLVESSVGLDLTFATNLFIGKEPGLPDDCVTIFDTPSFPPDITMTKGESYFRSSFQIRVRNRKYDTGMTLAWDIFNQLHERADEDWGDSIYELIRATGEPALLDWDENERPRIIINFDVQRR